MTALALRLRAGQAVGGSTAGWVGVALLVASLFVIVAARWAAVTLGVNGLLVGLAFGGALVALWLGTAREVAITRTNIAARAPVDARARVSARTLTVGAIAGLGFGLLLVAVTVAGGSIAGTVFPPGLSRPAAPFIPWVLVTLVVATAEEAILRGVLLDRVRAVGGLAPAVVLTTLVFALIHVPVYGWHVVPLDLAVGLGLAGLRLSTRTIAAPAVAHVIADLATWWL